MGFVWFVLFYQNMVKKNVEMLTPKNGVKMFVFYKNIFFTF